MCANCGCGGDKTTMLDLQTGDTTTIVTHQHEGATGHGHAHDHDHDHGAHERAHHHHQDASHGQPGNDHSHSHHAHGHSGLNILDVQTRILAKNDATAARNRAWCTGREILALNFVSSPGGGKTTLLER